MHDWVSAINEVLKPSESWCQPHRFNSFAPTRGLVEDGSHAQWFIDGKSAFEAIASSIETANSEVWLFNTRSITDHFYLLTIFNSISIQLTGICLQIYITGWWLCPELYLRRPFHNHNSSRLDVLLEAKAKQGVQVQMKNIFFYIWGPWKLVFLFRNSSCFYEYYEHSHLLVYFCYLKQYSTVFSSFLIVIDYWIYNYLFSVSAFFL